MNKKLIKRVAVANLATLMSIPNLATVPGNNTNIVYATSATEIHQKTLENYEKQLKEYEAMGNTVMIEKTKQRIEQTKQQLAGSVQLEKEQAQKVAQAAAAQVEKDRIANTIYPLHARYVKDFVPAVNDHKPHLYERPDLPGVIFTLKQDEWGKIQDVKPNIIVEGEAPDLVYVAKTDIPGAKVQSTEQNFIISYISPFNFFGLPQVGYDALIETNKMYLNSGFCHHIGKNISYQISREINSVYYEGFPAEYIGKTVGTMLGHESIAFNGGKPKDRMTAQDMQNYINGRGIVYFTPQEKYGQHRFRNYNVEHGAAWIEDQDIYTVAKENGTDYTDAERPLYDIRKKQSEMTEDERRLSNSSSGEMISMDLDPVTGEIKKSTFNNDKSFWNR